MFFLEATEGNLDKALEMCDKDFARPMLKFERKSHVRDFTNSCKICTSCATCTGFGEDCVNVKKKDRSQDKGDDCGCGPGDSGCICCGLCSNCMLLPENLFCPKSCADASVHLGYSGLMLDAIKSRDVGEIEVMGCLSISA